MTAVYCMTSSTIFLGCKKYIRIMAGCSFRDTCRKLFINLEILPLPSQYILFLLMFLIRNKSHFFVTSEKHHINTRQHSKFHQPSVNVAKYQNGVYYLGAIVFCELHSVIKTEFNIPKKFEVILQKFLNEKFFYSLVKYFNFQER